MLPGMNFRIFFSDRFFSLRWAALNEVSAEVTAAVGKGALDLPASHAEPAGVPSTPLTIPRWRGSVVIIETSTTPVKPGQNVVATVKRKVFRGSRSKKLGEYVFTAR
jgi:hypothetical protein